MSLVRPSTENEMRLLFDSHSPHPFPPLLSVRMMLFESLPAAVLVCVLSAFSLAHFASFFCRGWWLIPCMGPFLHRDRALPPYSSGSSYSYVSGPAALPVTFLRLRPLKSLSPNRRRQSISRIRLQHIKPRLPSKFPCTHDSLLPPDRNFALEQPRTFPFCALVRRHRPHIIPLMLKPTPRASFPFFSLTMALLRLSPCSFSTGQNSPYLSLPDPIGFC